MPESERLSDDKATGRAIFITRFPSAYMGKRGGEVLIFLYERRTKRNAATSLNDTERRIKVTAVYTSARKIKANKRDSATFTACSIISLAAEGSIYPLP